jgi:hypothetical protein
MLMRCCFRCFLSLTSSLIHLFFFFSCGSFVERFCSPLLVHSFSLLSDVVVDAVSGEAAIRSAILVTAGG